MIEPISAVSHIQTNTPGPPICMAMATPEIFPKPTVAANTALNA